MITTRYGSRDGTFLLPGDVERKTIVGSLVDPVTKSYVESFLPRKRQFLVESWRTRWRSYVQSSLGYLTDRKILAIANIEGLRLLDFLLFSYHHR
jgi:hypothetical protein